MGGDDSHETRQDFTLVHRCVRGDVLPGVGIVAWCATGRTDTNLESQARLLGEARGQFEFYGFG